MIIGHQKIKNYFERIINQNNLAHAYLFAGPENVGKFTLASWIAQKLINQEDINSHPDVLIIKPEIKEEHGKIKELSITIDQIRKLKERFSLSPFQSQYKIAIIDQADRLTPQAQNTCLKLLEELKDCKNLIILVTSHPHLILPTIISRCQIINFGLVDSGEMNKITNDNQLINLSWGRPGRLIKLIKDKNQSEEYLQYFQLWSSLKQKQIWDKFKKIQTISQDIFKTKNFINTWLILNRQELIERIKDNDLAAAERNLNNIHYLISAYSLLSKSGLNVRILLENLLLKVK